MQKRVNKKFEGFTLTEAMMAVVILGFACSAVLLPFSSGASVRAEGARRTLAAKLASDLVEQIVNSPFDLILDTYGDYSEGYGQLKKADGSFFNQAVYSRFGRKAICTNWPQDYPQDNFILITVKVYYNGREIAQIQRLTGR